MAAFASLLVSGCKSKQGEAYAKAVVIENEQGANYRKSTKAYKEVIRMNPSSKWAEKAQGRVDTLQEKIDADDQRMRDIFLKN